MTIQIDINRTGFPVKIGKLDLWFDSSLENLRSFFNIQEVARQKLKEAQEKAKHIHFPEVVESIEDVEVETVDAAMDVNKEFIAAQYDVIFGDGTFKKIYTEHPDVLALEEALGAVCFAIANRIEEMEIERSAKVETRKLEYLNKKAQKK